MVCASSCSLALTAPPPLPLHLLAPGVEVPVRSANECGIPTVTSNQGRPQEGNGNRTFPYFYGEIDNQG